MTTGAPWRIFLPILEPKGACMPRTLAGRLTPAAALPSLLALLLARPAAADDANYKGRNAAQWVQALRTDQMATMDALQSGDKAALPVLTELLKSEHAVVRSTAAGGLRELGEAAVPALPALIVATKDKDLNVRYYALSAIKRIGPAAASAVPALIEELSTHPNSEPGLEGPVRYYKDARSVAAEALGAIGPPAKAALPRLKEVAGKDDDAEVRSAAGAAVALIEKK
jgi:HEAT repeat protein